MSSQAVTALDQISGKGIHQNLSEQLQLIYQRISRQYPFLSCISVAAPAVTSDDGAGLYSTSCANRKQPANPVSSLALPLVAGNRKLGYTFFAAPEMSYFTPEVIEQMNVYSRVIAQLLNSVDTPMADLRSAVSSILQINNANKSESPAHLRRVAMYARLIAENCAEQYQLSEDWINHLEMFAPLHDIGKVFIPEHILMKPEHLTDTEFEQVKKHTIKGLELIDHMIDCLGHHDRPHYINMLRNIVALHHEAMDGSGYPYGLKAGEIPLEARIVAAADVLDALLTRRAYKEAWSIDKTMSTLQAMAGTRLDPEFVKILHAHQDELMAIRARCSEAS